MGKVSVILAILLSFPEKKQKMSPLKIKIKIKSIGILKLDLKQV